MRGGMDKHDPTIVYCSYPRCKKHHKNHYWGRIAAQGEGWYFSRHGESWCPDHLPGWVSTWREKKLNRRNKTKEN